MNIRECEVVYASDNATAIRLNFSDTRSWLFQFETKSLAKRFEFSIRESQKNIEGASVYIKGDRFERNLRFFGLDKVN